MTKIILFMLTISLQTWAQTSSPNEANFVEKKAEILKNMTRNMETESQWLECLSLNSTDKDYTTKKCAEQKKKAIENLKTEIARKKEMQACLQASKSFSEFQACSVKKQQKK